MIRNNQKYISLLNTYVEENKISNLENENFNDAHGNSYYILEPTPEKTEEKNNLFTEDFFFSQNTTAKNNVPGQNISLLFYYSIFLSLAICLIIAILLKTQKYINIDTTFPKRVFLFSFFLNNLSYSNQSFNNYFGPINAISNTSHIYIDESILINVNNSAKTVFNNTVYANDLNYNSLFSISSNSIKFNQNYGRDLEIRPNVVITGRLKASSISFGPFKIEHNILSNVLEPSNSQLLSSNHIVTDFLLHDKYLAVTETNKISVFYLDQKQIKYTFKPKLIYQKILNDKNIIKQIRASKNDAFTFFLNDDHKDEIISVRCKDKKCEQLDFISQNNDFISEELFDKFGAKIDLIENSEGCHLNYCFDSDCTAIPIQFNSDLIGCGDSKPSVNEDGNVYVVIPEKKIVRIFEDINNELTYTDEPLDIQIGTKYQPIKMSSFLITLNEGILDVFQI